MFCANSQFQITPNTNINKVLWNFGDALSANNTDTFINTTHVYTDTGTYNARLILATQCSSDTLRATIKINGKQQSNTDINICKNLLPYLWNGTLYNTAGNYIVVQKDRFGCDSICNLNLTIKVCDTVIVSNCFITIPNAFSPNGDGINDYFLPITTCTPQQYNLTIFTRWGQQIFTSTNYKTQWMGTYKNKEVPIGVYYFVMNVKFPFESKKVLSGYVTLIR